MNQTVGMIGTGVLGSAMAVVLIENGFEVVGFDIDPAKLAALGEHGIKAAASARDVADRAGAIVTCLPSVEALHEAVSATDGIAASAAAGHIVIETSTVPIAEKERARDALAAVGKTMLDCPVSRLLVVRLEPLSWPLRVRVGPRWLLPYLQPACLARHAHLPGLLSLVPLVREPGVLPPPLYHPPGLGLSWS